MPYTSTVTRGKNEQEYVEQTGETAMRDLSLIRATSKRPKRKILNLLSKRIRATQHWLVNWKYHSAYLHAFCFLFLWFLKFQIHSVSIPRILTWFSRLQLSLGRSYLLWRTLLENSPPATFTRTKFNTSFNRVWRVSQLACKWFYQITKSALPPASGVAFFADDDDVLVFENRQQIIVGRAVIGHHLGCVELVLPWNL